MRNFHEGHRDYVCDFCDMAFIYQTSLKVHLSKKHSEFNKAQKIVECEFCSKEFISDRLKTHIQQVHDSRSNFECEKCKKTLSSGFYLKRHIKTVHGLERYSCKHCSKLFKSDQYLTQHISTVHFKKKHYKCETCNKSFTQWIGLNLHKKSKIHSESTIHI